MMKKILIVGGGIRQVQLLKSAKLEGYYVILCDMTSECPGYKYADRFYSVSILDCEALLNVAKSESIDGIISNSEPAMPIVTRISQKMNLVGNPEDSIKVLMSKSKFRDLQKKCGVYSPNHFFASNVNELFDQLPLLQYPIIIKPAECSGSRGSQRIDFYNRELVERVFCECLKFSRNNIVAIEEFVEMPSLTTIEGDIFLYNGELLWDGLFYTTRASWAPMVPMTYTAPLFLDKSKLNKVKKTLTDLFISAGIIYGEYNIEGYFTRNEEFFVIEINVRQGGHEIPLFIKDYSGIDLCKLLVTTAVGDNYYWDFLKTYTRQYSYAVKQTSFSSVPGLYDGLYISDMIEPYVQRVVNYLKLGQSVEKCIDGSSLVAIVDLLFSTQEEQREFFEKLDQHIRVKVK